MAETIIFSSLLKVLNWKVQVMFNFVTIYVAIGGPRKQGIKTKKQQDNNKITGKWTMSKSVQFEL